MGCFSSSFFSLRFGYRVAVSFNKEYIEKWLLDQLDIEPQQDCIATSPLLVIESTMKCLRLFISLRPDSQVLKAWNDFQIRAPAWPVRWTPLDQLHITLKFLGETPPEREPKIILALREAVANRAPFSLQLKGGGLFPPKGSPSTIWAGVEGNIDALVSLAVSVEKACEPLEFPLEKRTYHPHLTVGRAPSEIKPGKNLRWLRSAYQEWIANFESPAFSVKDIVLMQSHLSPRGSQYEVRSVWPMSDGLT